MAAERYHPSDEDRRRLGEVMTQWLARHPRSDVPRYLLDHQRPYSPRQLTLAVLGLPEPVPDLPRELGQTEPARDDGPAGRWAGAEGLFTIPAAEIGWDAVVAAFGGFANERELR
jgi:hypothetical protein